MPQQSGYNYSGETLMNICYEKRQHHRLSTALQLLFWYGDQVDEKEMKTGLTENISISGLYFICLDCQEFEQVRNQVINLIIKVPAQDKDIVWSNLLKANAQILRVDTVPGRPQARGVALKFIGDLRFVHS